MTVLNTLVIDILMKPTTSSFRQLEIFHFSILYHDTSLYPLCQRIKIQFSQIQAFFGQATVINPKVEKSRTRIVDFDSSSDEEKKDDDKRENSEWREEVDDLQQTLNSLGLEEDRRQVRVSEEPAREFFVGEKKSSTSSGGATN